jgi:hemoglobin
MHEPSPIRRARIVPGIAAGVDEAMIERLVRTFYGQVRRDSRLGPVFNRQIDDWEQHIARLCDFWSSVMLMTGRFKGQPMLVHTQLADIGPEHFARWLQIFHQTAGEVCPPEAAALFRAKADQIGDSLQLGIAVSRGEPLPPLRRPANNRQD